MDAWQRTEPLKPSSMKWRIDAIITGVGFWDIIENASQYFEIWTMEMFFQLGNMKIGMIGSYAQRFDADCLGW